MFCTHLSQFGYAVQLLPERGFSYMACVEEMNKPQLVLTLLKIISWYQWYISSIDIVYVQSSFQAMSTKIAEDFELETSIVFYEFQVGITCNNDCFNIDEHGNNPNSLMMKEKWSYLWCFLLYGKLLLIAIPRKIRARCYKMREVTTVYSPVRWLALTSNLAIVLIQVCMVEALVLCVDTSLGI